MLIEILSKEYVIVVILYFNNTMKSHECELTITYLFN